MKNLKIINKSKQAGFAMIEILLMIGVLIALTAVMVYALYGKVSRQSKVQTASEQMVQIASSVRAYIRSNQHGTVVKCMDKGCLNTNPTDDMALLGGYGLEQSISDHSATANPWGGPYTVNAKSAPAPANTFQVKMSNLPAYFAAKNKGGNNNYLSALTDAVQHAGDRSNNGTAEKATTCAAVTGSSAGGATVTCTFNV